MNRTVLVVSLALPLCTCAGRVRIAPPPALFPLTTVWTSPLEETIEGPLATDGARIFVTTRGGAVRGFDIGMGGELWRVERRPGRLAAGPDLLVLRESNGTMWAMEPESGSARFKVDAGVAGELPPVIDGDLVLVAGEGLAALRASDGGTLWSVPAPPVVTARPLAVDKVILVGEADGTLRCRDRASGRSLWTHSTGSKLLAPPVVDDRRRVLLGTTDGRFLALSLEDKGERRWRWKLGADVQAPAVVLGDLVLFASHEDVLYALKRSNGHMIWRASLPSRPLAGPLLVGSAVVVACFENDIVGFDARTGKKLGTLKTSEALRAAPLLIGERIYVGLLHSLAAFRMPGATPAE